MIQRVFICSPLRGNAERNMRIARYLCARAVKEGYAPFAPHLFYTQFLDDTITAEREAGIACGVAFLKSCSSLFYWAGKGISAGMKAEIAIACESGLQIVDVTDWLDPLPVPHADRQGQGSCWVGCLTHEDCPQGPAFPDEEPRSE